MLEYLVKEVKKHLVERCGHMQGGKERVIKIINSEWTKAEKIKAIRYEYGIGGGSVTIAVFDTGFSDWDSKGINYRFYDLKTQSEEEEQILFNWNQVFNLLEKEYLK